MALMACRECGREISSRASACPQCGAPVEAQTMEPFFWRFKWWLLGGLLLLLALRLAWPTGNADADAPQFESITTPERAAEVLAAIPPAPESWALAGRQGSMHFVTINDVETGKPIYHQAVAELCAGKTHCMVNFWIDAAMTPRSLPMSEAQAAAQVAGYRLNTTNGLSSWGWRCAIFPETPSGQCF
jgi:hypothetical protein